MTDSDQPQQVDATRVIRALQTAIGQLHTDLAMRDILIEDLRVSRVGQTVSAPPESNGHDLADDRTLPLHQQ